MRLGQFRDYIESLPDGTKFNYSLSEPFSWRGSYDEVAFSIEEQESTREELLGKINQALTDEFIGWKGGEFYYGNNTEIHFEREEGAYSDGQYTRDKIAEILLEEPYESEEQKLISLIFKHQ